MARQGDQREHTPSTDSGDRGRWQSEGGEGEPFEIAGAHLTCKVKAEDSGYAFRFSSRHFVRGEAVPLHSHASAEAFCVLTGTIEFFRVVAGEQDRICCETGALMIVPPNALHALRNNTSQRGRLLGISTQLHRAFFDAVVAADKRRTFASLPLPEVLKLIVQFGPGTTCTS